MTITRCNLGVVVIGRNEGSRLADCLASLKPYDVPVVYVDSGSVDGSQAVARSAGADVIELDAARPFTAARARSEGAIALLSRYPGLNYIQFVDGDCSVSPNWLETASAFLDESPSYAVVCGRRRERHPDRSLYNTLADLEWATAVGDAHACGGDALYRVKAYCDVRGFDSRLIAGEEPELCRRLQAQNWRIRRLDQEMTVHDAAMTRLAQWWQRAVRSGFGYAQAWRLTRHFQRPLYRREVLRAVAWTSAPVSAGITAGLFIHPALLLLAPMVYVLQILRLASHFGIREVFSWQRASLLTLGKLAETQGVLRFTVRSLTRSVSGTVFNK